ncbi:hypothetical protein [Mesorhizobium sp. Cs1321R2N1]
MFTKPEVKLPRQAFFCYPSSDFRLHAGFLGWRLEVASREFGFGKLV